MSNPPPPTAVQTRELFHVYMVLQGRIDPIWERLVYTHAAIATVMAFLSENFTPNETYLVTRLVVFSFYTSTWPSPWPPCGKAVGACRPGCRTSRPAHAGEELSHIDRWMLKLDYRTHPWRRVVLLISVWLVLGYLLLQPVTGQLIELVAPGG